MRQARRSTPGRESGDRRFGELPEYFVKLGGIGSLRSGYDWHERSVKPSSDELAAALRPYFEWRVKKLGADRCMFESNFPVEKLSTAYVNLCNGEAIRSRHHRLQRANVGRLSALLRDCCYLDCDRCTVRGETGETVLTKWTKSLLESSNPGGRDSNLASDLGDLYSVILHALSNYLPRTIGS